MFKICPYCLLQFGTCS